MQRTARTISDDRTVLGGGETTPTMAFIGKYRERLF
jgi:hypothetical protein